MKGSFIIIAFFLFGLILSYLNFLPDFITNTDYSKYALYILIFFVGISIGNNKDIIKSLKKKSWRITAVPMCTIIGSLIGSAVISLFIASINLTDCMAIGSGLGYYSLSSVLIGQSRGPELGTIALITNIARELLALFMAPILVRLFGKYAPIVAGGATTMDTTLPVITRYSGEEYVLIAIIHGFICDISVPFLVSFFLFLG